MSQDDKEKREPAKVIWEGDSLEVVKGFPAAIKQKLGEDLRFLQQGLLPRDSRPMKSIGSKVAELRQRDKNGWYRTIYLGVINGKIHVLHSFIKRSGKTPQNDLDIATKRLKAVRARLRKEKEK